MIIVGNPRLIPIRSSLPLSERNVSGSTVGYRRWMMITVVKYRRLRRLNKSVEPSSTPRHERDSNSQLGLLR